MTANSTVTPESETEAGKLIADAAKSGARLRIDGGSTKSEIGRPVFSDKAMTSAGLCGITSYNPAELVMTVRAGTPMSEIDAALAEAGQRLSFEPPDLRGLLGTRGEPTIGAVAAANLSGPRRIVAGAARDSLLGVRFINGKGEIVTNGGRVMKNVTGLDLVKLMAGSWGTLGFLTEVTFKVLPAPQTEKTLALAGLDDEAATRAMAHAMASSAEVSGAAHLPELVSAKLTDGGPATLLRLEGFAESVADRMSRLKTLFDGVADHTVLDEQKSQALWQDVRDVKPFHGDRRIVWRISMAPSRAHEFVMALRMEAAADAFYDWQGGLVWLAVEDQPQDEIIRPLLARYGGGHATLIRADSQFRQLVPVFQPLAPPLAALSERIRASFDPHGILNPGRMAA